MVCELTGRMDRHMEVKSDLYKCEMRRLGRKNEKLYRKKDFVPNRVQEERDQESLSLNVAVQVEMYRLIWHTQLKALGMKHKGEVILNLYKAVVWPHLEYHV